MEVRSIAKTVLDLSGIKNHGFAGKNLLIAAEEDGKNNIAYSVRLYGRRDFPESEAIMMGNWKLIKNLTENSFELYDLNRDPIEKTDLFESEHFEINDVREDLISKLSGIKQEKTKVQEIVNLSDEEIKQLKALGYIQ